jgi:hypothetical protein
MLSCQSVAGTIDEVVSMRRPEVAPFGDTFFDARVRAIVAASLLNKPSGGWVESVLTDATHRWALCLAVSWSSALTPYHLGGFPVRLQHNLDALFLFFMESFVSSGRVLQRYAVGNHKTRVDFPLSNVVEETRQIAMHIGLAHF